MGLAIGVLHMAPDEFFEMRLKHFFLKLQEYNRNRESEIKTNSELVRLQTTALINIQLKPSDKITPQQLWRFPWDEETEVAKKLAQLSAKELGEAYGEFINKSKL